MSLVLYIDDNRIMLENGAEMLELAGYEVIVACNGEEGFALAKEKKPDIILCDVIMPVQDGYTTITQLKNDTTLAQIPFVFVTASAEKSEINKGLKLGAVAYIRKPFEGDELLDTVNKWLRSSNP